MRDWRTPATSLLLALGLAWAMPGHAQQTRPAPGDGDASADEMAALELAAPPPAAPATGRDGSATWGFEAALGHDTWRDWTFAGAPPQSLRSRLSAQVRGRTELSPHWTAVYMQRVDVDYRRGSGSLSAGNVSPTLSEAYLGYAGRRLFADLGRFNERLGVAYGYNPTDFFRHDAVVARASEDPTLLRSTRLGVVGARFQYIGDNGALALIYAPRLRRAPQDGALSPHLERSNSDTQWLLRMSRRLSERTLVEGLAYYREGTGWQPGMNLSTLVGQRTVLYTEWSMSREADVDVRADAVDPRAPHAAPRLRRGAYRSRLATGASVTLGRRVQAVLEAQYDGTGLDAQASRRLATPQTPAELRRYLRLRDYVTQSQSLLSRRYLFARLSLARPFGEKSSLSGFVRYNLDDRSRYLWLQAGRQFGSVDCSLTVAMPLGSRASEYGDVQARRTTLLTLEWAL